MTDYHIELNGRTGRMRNVGTWNEDGEGGSYSRIVEISGDLAQAITAMGDEERREAMAELFPGERCCHEYDCCGNWYPRNGEVICAPGYGCNVLVSQSYQQNI